MIEIIKNILPNKLSGLIFLGTISLALWLFSNKELSLSIVSGFRLASESIWLFAPIGVVLLGTFLTLVSVLFFIGQKPKLPSNYARKKIAAGNFAVIPENVDQATDATHKLCASCFEKGKPSTLSQTREPARMIGLVCPNGCPKLVFTHYES